MRRMAVATLLAGIMVLGCGDRDDRLATWKGVDGPLVVGNQVVYVDHNFDEALIITPEAGNTTPDWERVPVAEGGKLVGVVDSLGVVLVQSAAEGVLQAIDPKTGDVTDHDVGASFDRFVVVDDPPLVGAFYSEQAQGDGDSLLVNKGEVAFIDLKKTDNSVRKVVVPTYGGAPLGVDIGQRVALEGGGKLLAFVRWNSFISIVDAEKDSPLKSVKLKAPDSTTFVSPMEMQFHVLGPRLLAFFLAQGSKDLHMLDVEPSKLGEKGAGASLNLFPTASGASMFALFRLPGNTPGVIVLCPTSRIAAVVDPESSEVTLYPLDLAARNLEIFEMPAADTGKTEQFAFLYDDTGYAYGYYFVELDRLKEKKSQAFHYYALASKVRRVYPLGSDRFLVLHEGGSSPMSQVNASDSSVISVGGDLTISSEVLPLGSSIMYALGKKVDKTYLIAFDVNTFASRSIEVSHGSSPDKVQLMPDSGLLLASAGASGLVVVPEGFAEEKDAVEFLAPFLFGLGNREVAE